MENSLHIGQYYEDRNEDVFNTSFTSKLLLKLEQKGVLGTADDYQLVEQHLEALRLIRNGFVRDISSNTIAVFGFCISALRNAEGLLPLELDVIFDIIEETYLADKSKNELWLVLDILLGATSIAFIKCTSEDCGEREIYFKGGSKLLQISMDILNDISLEHHSFDQVMQKLFFIGEKTCNLELKTMATYWKFFLRLLQRCSGRNPQIKPLPTMLFLVGEIQELLTHLKNGKDNSVRMIKVGGFYLRTVVNLLDIFSDALCNEELITKLLDLLLLLLNFTGDVNRDSMFQGENNAGELRNLCETQIGLGIGPILNRILPSKIFTPIVTDNFNNLLEKDPLSSCRLISKLLLPKKQGQTQHNHPLPYILELFLKAVDQNHLAFSGNVQLYDVMHSGRPQLLVPAYELLCTEACAGMAVASILDMQECVVVLLENVVHSTVWGFLMATDILCFIARLGTSSFCRDLFFSVVDLLCPSELQQLLPASNQTNYRLLMLLNRLLNFLSSGAREELLVNYPVDAYKNLWASLDWRAFPSQLNAFIEQYMATIENGLSKNLISSLLLLHSLFIFNQQSFSQNAKKFVSILLTNFASISQSLENHKSNFLTAIVSCCINNIVDYNNQQELQNVLCFFSATHHSNSSQLFVAQVLRDLSTLKIPPSTHQQPLLRIISSLFNQLLSSRNPIVQHSALEAFTEFARRTPHTTLVPSCVKDEEQQQFISNFLENKQVSSPALSVLLGKERQLLLRKTDEEHIRAEEEENVESVMKKPRLEEEILISEDQNKDIMKSLQTLKDSVEFLERKKTSLPQWAKIKIADYCEQLNAIVD